MNNSETIDMAYLYESYAREICESLESGDFIGLENHHISVVIDMFYMIHDILVKEAKEQGEAFLQFSRFPFTTMKLTGIFKLA